MNLCALPIGGALDVDRARVDQLREKFIEESLQPRGGISEPAQVNAPRVDYVAAYNSTSNAPSGPTDGVATAYGRTWAEVRSVTNSGGAGVFEVAVIATQNGSRAIVRGPAGTTILGGSIVWWTFDPRNQEWSPNTETFLQVGFRSATVDDFQPVGSR